MNLERELFDALSLIVEEYVNGEVHIWGCQREKHGMPPKQQPRRTYLCSRIIPAWKRGVAKFGQECPHCHQPMKSAHDDAPPTDESFRDRQNGAEAEDE